MQMCSQPPLFEVHSSESGKQKWERSQYTPPENTLLSGAKRSTPRIDYILFAELISINTFEIIENEHFLEFNFSLVVS